MVASTTSARRRRRSLGWAEISSSDRDGCSACTTSEFRALKQSEHELRDVNGRLERAAELSGLSLWEFVMTDGLVTHSRLRNDRTVVPKPSPVTVSDYASVLEAAWIVDKDAFTAAVKTGILGAVGGGAG